MSFLRLNKNQIGLQAIGNSHIDPSEPIAETNLNLDVKTSALARSISDLSSGLSGLQNKMVAVFGQISNLAVAQSASVLSAVDGSLIGVYPSGVLVAGGDSDNEGLITAEPFNKIPMKIHGTNLPLEMQEGGPDIYGRLVFNEANPEGSKYDIELFYLDASGVEQTALVPSACTVDMLIPMSMLLANVPFQSLTHGVAFVDGLPAEHFHEISSVNGLQDSLDALDTRVTTNEGDISTLLNDLSAVDGRVTVNEGNISTLQTEMLAAQAEIDGLEESTVGIGDVALLANIKEGVDLSAQADGVLATFAVGENFVSNTLRVFVNGSRQTRGVQYNENGASGEFTFVAGAIPVSTDSVTVDYVKLV